MKYLVTITLIALSINVFSMDKYVVCMEQVPESYVVKSLGIGKGVLEVLTDCVNTYMEQGYVPLSGLHGTTARVNNSHTTFFQSLVYKGKKK